MDIGIAIAILFHLVLNLEKLKFLEGIIHETRETQRIIARNRFLKQYLSEKKKQITFLRNGFARIEEDTRYVHCGNRIGTKFILKSNNDILDFICDEM